MKWTAVGVHVPTALRMNAVTAQSATTRPREAKTMSRAVVKVNDLSWMTGGPQGSGVDSSANIFAGACMPDQGLRVERGQHVHAVYVGSNLVTVDPDFEVTMRPFDARVVFSEPEGPEPTQHAGSCENVGG